MFRLHRVSVCVHYKRPRLDEGNVLKKMNWIRAVHRSVLEKSVTTNVCAFAQRNRYAGRVLVVIEFSPCP